MRRPKKVNRMSEAEYLAFEAASKTRHEYVDGYIFAMTGATRAHNLISMNIGAFLHGQLRGGPCSATMHDLKIKIESARSFYYPDVMVACDRFEAKAVYVSEPVLLVEVLSPSTTGTDRREKLIAYQKIPTLKEYLIVYQDRQQVELHRKGADGQWVYFIVNADEELVLESLPTGAVPLPFATIYDGYDAPLRVKEDDESEYTLLN
jgi:Uma2 family endonuclease